MAPFQRLFALAATIPSLFDDYRQPHDRPQNGRPPCEQVHGAVASENDLCSRIGTTVLQTGGNAVDAAVATTFCVGVVAMHHSGIGGGGFLIVREPSGESVVIDFRETAPAAATEDMFVNRPEEQIYGGKAAGVPGELRGLEEVHRRYGRLSWSEVVMPAVHLARNGWPVNQDSLNYRRLAVAGSAAAVDPTLGNSSVLEKSFLVKDPDFAIDFAPNGTLLGLGEIFRRPRYADTLERIAKEGPDAFYLGSMADATIRAIRSRGGIMTHRDLASYSVVVRKPVETFYRGHRVLSVSAPASGASLALILNTIEGFDDLGAPDQKNLSTHRIIEAMRFGYAGRAELGDPAFIFNVSSIQSRMVDKDTAAKVRSRIDGYSHPVDYYNPLLYDMPVSHGTSQISVADGDGLAMSITTTVNLLFGNRQVVPETGVLLNNEMDDFSTPGVPNSFGFVPASSNFVRPGARPVSSISATIIEGLDKQLEIVTGAAGGSRILSSTLLSIINMIDYKMNVSAALAAPRFHDQLQPDTVRVEYAFDNSTAAFLIERKHNVTWMAPGLSVVHAIHRLENGTFEAAGEPRQLNSAGYAI